MQCSDVALRSMLPCFVLLVKLLQLSTPCNRRSQGMEDAIIRPCQYQTHLSNSQHTKLARRRSMNSKQALNITRDPLLAGAASQTTERGGETGLTFSKRSLNKGKHWALRTFSISRGGGSRHHSFQCANYGGLERNKLGS